MKTKVELEVTEKGTLVCPACGLEIPVRDETGKARLYFPCPNECEQEIVYYPKEKKQPTNEGEE